MTLPLVSIITPSYNQAEYLEATIQSVLAQEYPNLEYIIVDGGSKDDSVAIIQKYADRISWWVSEPDQGQADAINKGFRRARGEIVAWLNSDDLFLPGAIPEAVAAMQADDNLGMVYGDAITIDPAGRPINPLVFGDWGLAELMRFQIICQPAVFMRRNALKKIDYLDESYHLMLDHHLWLNMASVAHVKHAAKFWAAARHHPAAKNVSQSPNYAHEIYRAVDWMQTDPAFTAHFTADRRRIWGGAYRLAARYLLDGGLPGAALGAYGKALFYWPRYALKHWGRILFAVINLLGLGRLETWSRRRPPRLDDPRLQNWPGINLQHEA